MSDCVRKIDGAAVDDILDLIMHNKHIQLNSTRIDISVVINRQWYKRPVSNGVEFELSELWMSCVGWSI